MVNLTDKQILWTMLVASLILFLKGNSFINIGGLTSFLLVFNTSFLMILVFIGIIMLLWRRK